KTLAQVPGRTGKDRERARPAPASSESSRSLPSDNSGNQHLESQGEEARKENHHGPMQKCLMRITIPGNSMVERFRYQRIMTKRIQTTSRGARGFTLIELLVV